EWGVTPKPEVEEVADQQEQREAGASSQQAYHSRAQAAAAQVVRSVGALRVRPAQAPPAGINRTRPLPARAPRLAAHPRARPLAPRRRGRAGPSGRGSPPAASV